MCDDDNDDDDDDDDRDSLEPWFLKVNRILTDPPFGEPSTIPVEILPWLYLSSQHECTSRLHRIRDLGITHVLTVNVMPAETLKFLKSRLASFGIQHSAVPGFDEDGFDEDGFDMMGKFWNDPCRSILDSVRKSGGKVVVHCVAGQNRSGLLVAAALVDLEGWTLLRTVRHLKRCRGIVLTNLSFQRQLCVLAEQKSLLDEDMGEIEDGLSGVDA